LQPCRMRRICNRRQAVNHLAGRFRQSVWLDSFAAAILRSPSSHGCLGITLAVKNRHQRRQPHSAVRVGLGGVLPLGMP
jgi:hypothetical protein